MRKMILQGTGPSEKERKPHAVRCAGQLAPRAAHEFMPIFSCVTLNVLI